MVIRGMFQAGPVLHPDMAFCINWPSENYFHQVSKDGQERVLPLESVTSILCSCAVSCL